MYVLQLLLAPLSASALVIRESHVKRIQAAVSYPGELTPKAPHEPGVFEQTGRYQASYLRVACAKRTRSSWGASINPTLGCPSVREVMGNVVKVEARKRKHRATSLFVCMQEGWPGIPEAMTELLSRGYKFHHFEPSEDVTSNEHQQGQEFSEATFEASAPPGELCYYRWIGPLPDFQPDYATSIEGVSMLVYRGEQPHRKILMVYERRWKLAGGAVDMGESKLVAGMRELYEEVGVTVDPKTFTACGGWQIGKSRDNRVNDNFSCFAARLSEGSPEVKADDMEIKGADIAWVHEKVVFDMIDRGRASYEEALDKTHLKWKFDICEDGNEVAPECLSGKCGVRELCANNRTLGSTPHFLWMERYLKDSEGGIRVRTSEEISATNPTTSTGMGTLW